MIFCVEKPVGITSNQAVQLIKRHGGFNKVGHAGTLDPAASGILVIGTDESTKELSRLLLDNKEYVATIRFGVHTETYDATGFVVKYSRDVPSFELVQKSLLDFPTEYEQLPPAYSALKVNGERAYDLARGGQDVTLQPRTVHILQREFLGYKNGVLKVRLLVRKGFYVRSFAVDLAKNLNTYGVLIGLVRTRSGLYSLNDAKSLSEFGYRPERSFFLSEDQFSQTRDLFSVGQIERAYQLSRFRYSLSGKVIHGIKKARFLGYPTANIEHERENCPVSDGVYKSFTSYDGLKFRSLTFVGVGHGDGQADHKFESHLFNFEGDLYNQTIESHLVSFIRANKMFKRVEELVEQIKKDVAIASVN